MILTSLRWCALGLFAGFVLHYYLYRVGIPIVPFVYQAF
jgi:hypothetical protein